MLKLFRSKRCRSCAFMFPKKVGHGVGYYSAAAGKACRKCILRKRGEGCHKQGRLK